MQMLANYKARLGISNEELPLMVENTFQTSVSDQSFVLGGTAAKATWPIGLCLNQFKLELSEHASLSPAEGWK